MNANHFLFLFSVATGFIITTVFACLIYSSKGMPDALESCISTICCFAGITMGTILACAVFAFIAGKLTP